MTTLIPAELLKLRTVRATYWLALGVVVGAALSVVAAILTADAATSGAVLHTREGVRSVMSGAASGSTLVMILGILAMAGEFRYSTITQTLLITPNRGRVVVAKLVALAVVGSAFGALAGAVTLALAVPWLAAKGVDGPIVSGEVGLLIGGALVATALYGVIGVSIGTLIRNTTAAVVTALLWVLLLEGVVGTLLPEVGRWMPGGAAAALTGTGDPDGGPLPRWAGGLLLAGYGLTLALAGTRSALRRDVT